MAKQHFQKEMRRSFNARDQWNREWLVVIEISTGDPCFVNPNFADPLRTPGIYVRSEANASRLNIRYDLWQQQLTESRRDWEREFHQIGMSLYGDAYNANKALAQPKREQRLRAGSPPLDPDLVRRASQGDRELLGLDQLTPATAALLPEDYRMGVAVEQGPEQSEEEQPPRRRRGRPRKQAVA